MATGNVLHLPQPAKRIVSVVPSQTEMLFDLGLDEEVIGVTLFCIHPKKKVKNKKKIGGTKKLKIDEIFALNPDLVLANKEENEKVQIEALREKLPVYISAVETLDDAYAMMKEVASLTGKDATALVNEIEIEAADFNKFMATQKYRSALYLIWRKPYMSIGKDTFIHSMMELCRLGNVCSNTTRYPELSVEEIARLNPEVVLLSSEPFPFKEKHIAELKAVLPQAEILLVDGEMFSWYGSRMRFSFKYFKNILSTLQ